MFAQLAARVLIQRLDVIGNIGPGHNAQRLDQLKPDALGQAGQGLVLFHVEKRLEQRRDPAVNPMRQPPPDLFRHIRARLIIHEWRDRRRQRIRALDQLANRIGAPHEPALIGHVELGIGGIIHAIGAEVELRL